MNIEKEKAVLAIPEVCVDQMIALYHSSLFAGHQRVVKTYLTMVKLNYVLNLRKQNKFLSKHKLSPVNLTWLSQVYGKMFNFPKC